MDTIERDVEDDFGYIKAYIISNTADSVSNHLPFNKMDDIVYVINSIEDQSFIYLEEIFIYQEFRRQGHASRMMIDFLSNMEDEEIPIILIAGADFTPKEMDIVGFYEDFGFDVLGDEKGKIVMIR